MSSPHIDLTDPTDPTDLTDLADRYAAVWNEPDAGRRHQQITDLWAPAGRQVLVDPPEEVRAAAEHHQFLAPPLTVHGHEALEARVTRAYDNFIAAGDYVFVASGPATRLLGHVVSLAWEMVATADGSHAGGGVNVVELDDDGRIVVDYQFIER
ncbi:MAG TPA: hypothetical protein VH479_14800 [Acidimicrobiales bacterium]